jgi:hypothetical protein
MAGFTPALIAAARRRYEETDQSLRSIAFDCDIGARTLGRLVEREGWRKRAKRPPRDLPRSMQLLEEAIALERAYEEQRRRK